MAGGIDGMCVYHRDFFTSPVPGKEKAKSFRFDLILHQREFYIKKGTDLF